LPEFVENVSHTVYTDMIPVFPFLVLCLKNILSMKKTVDNMKAHLAKIRFKKSVKAVIFMRRCKKTAIMGNIMKSLEEARSKRKLEIEAAGGGGDG